jgi:hypothetical protein
MKNFQRVLERFLSAATLVGADLPSEIHVCLCVCAKPIDPSVGTGGGLMDAGDAML